MDTLVESLKKLIEQSTEALGAESPSTLMLKQQLAAALAQQGKAPKVFWMQPVQDPSESGEKGSGELPLPARKQAP